MENESCPCCDDSFDEVYGLANCENVCNKCCPSAHVMCQECEFYE